MNGGDGPLSYAQNSSYQRGVIDVAKPIIEEEIAKIFDIKHVSNSALCIADFGCSTGHNSFPAIQIIIDAIKKKQKSSNLIFNTTPPQTSEFFVFFNDVATNDYNTLFSSLPADKGYHAAGVPGDFHRCLLPTSSLHFAYSSYSLHWLTEVPEAVADRNSPAWNKGRVLYSGERKDVCDAYLEQFGKDMEAFLECRAVEIMGGGLMALLIPGEYDRYQTDSHTNLLESCLANMAQQGRFNESKIDSFNIPYYLPTPQQLKVILHRSQTFCIQRMEILNNPGKHTIPSAEAQAAFFRAVLEGLLTAHFGSEIIDELFDLFAKKLAAAPDILNPSNDNSIVVLVVLKRMID